jgi:hypothetical protein
VNVALIVAGSVAILGAAIHGRWRGGELFEQERRWGRAVPLNV